ncbi:MAG TPA: septum site-determining protein MinC [Syntrophomonadaceae bacterium]|nr:septum site-determining protein MinC [Syntrophomonadaceae bacterium]
MQATARNFQEEKLIDLKAFHTFGEMKVGLEQRLGDKHQYSPGVHLVIDIGTKQLNSRQVRELEDVLLDRGMHLKEVLSSASIRPDSMKTEIETAFSGMPGYGETVLICRHLRSGQRFFSPGNLVILGDINPGAEVIAVGNILVMGALKGVAHAGYLGDESAVIAAYRLNPTQLRIANHITRPPDGEKVMVREPEMARIRTGKVVIEKLKI